MLEAHRIVEGGHVELKGAQTLVRRELDELDDAVEALDLLLGDLDEALEYVAVEQATQRPVAVVRVRQLIVEVLVERGHNRLAVDVYELARVERLVFLTAYSGRRRRRRRR